MTRLEQIGGNNWIRPFTYRLNNSLGFFWLCFTQRIGFSFQSYVTTPYFLRQEKAHLSINDDSEKILQNAAENRKSAEHVIPSQTTFVFTVTVTVPGTAIVAMTPCCCCCCRCCCWWWWWTPLESWVGFFASFPLTSSS